MATKMSALVMVVADGHDQEIAYYVRSMRAGIRPISSGGASERDAWEAVEETPVLVTVDGVRQDLRRVEGLSDAPRATPEEAARDMWRAVAQRVSRPGARLARGEMPEDLAADVRFALAAASDPGLASDLSDA